ncbi:hypothetical protein D3C81_1119710 [compost metagenome]
MRRTARRGIWRPASGYSTIPTDSFSITASSTCFISGTRWVAITATSVGAIGSRRIWSTGSISRWHWCQEPATTATAVIPDRQWWRTAKSCWRIPATSNTPTAPAPPTSAWRKKIPRVAMTNSARYYRYRRAIAATCAIRRFGVIRKIGTWCSALVTCKTVAKCCCCAPPICAVGSCWERLPVHS